MKNANEFFSGIHRESIGESLKSPRDLAGEMHVLSGAGMGEAECLGMKRQAVKPTGVPSVFHIPHYRVAHIGSVYPNLILPSGIKLKLHKGVSLETSEHLKAGNGHLAPFRALFSVVTAAYTFSFFPIPGFGSYGVDLKSRIFFKTAAYLALVFLHYSLNKSDILAR